jgi:hypothetical protein
MSINVSPGAEALREQADNQVAKRILARLGDAGRADTCEGCVHRGLQVPGALDCHYCEYDGDCVLPLGCNTKAVLLVDLLKALGVN